MNARLVSKIVFSISALAALALSAGCSALQVKTGAQDVNAAAGAITAYTLPEGYQAQFAVQVKGYQLAGFVGPSESCHLFLAQAPAGTDVSLEEMSDQVDTMRSGRGDRPQKLAVVEKKPVTLRGQAATLLVSEGEDSEGQPYRSVSAMFAGKTGPALVNLSAPVDQWDQALVDQFLTSLQ